MTYPSHIKDSETDLICELHWLDPQTGDLIRFSETISNEIKKWLTAVYIPIN